MEKRTLISTTGEPRERRAAFTLVELLVTIALVAILASLLTPAVTSALERGRAAHCENNLRQAGTGTLSRSVDRDALIYLYSFSEGRETSWAGEVFQAGEVPERNVFVCPSYAPHRFHPTFSWFSTYGIWIDPPPETIVSTSDGAFNLATHTVDEPTAFTLLADSTSAGRDGLAAKQHKHFLKVVPHHVHARHHRKAFIFFLDGHVEGMDENRLERVGVTPLVGEDAAFGYF